MCKFLKYILPLLLILFCLSLEAQLPKVKRAFPEGVPSKVKFGMSVQEFKNLFKDLKPVKQDYDFREVYLMDPNHPDISGLVFYFDADNEKPLYEVMVVYRDLQTAAKTAKKMFGSPNYEEEEWRTKYKKQTLWSWVYRDKIVLVADIPETEWSDKF